MRTGFSIAIAAAALGACATPSTREATDECRPHGAPTIVYFDWDRSDITPPAAQALDTFAASFPRQGTGVVVQGHSDTEASPDYAIGLSQRRAASVRDYLIARGVPGGVITTEAYGSTRLAVPTGPGVREPQNRRAEVYACRVG